MAIQSAEGQVLQSLDYMLTGQDDSIIIPLTKINKTIADVVTSNAKTVNKLIGKVLKTIDRSLVTQDDCLNGIQTTVLQGLDQWLLNQQYMLESLAYKSNDLAIGDPLSALADFGTTDAPQVTYAGTLVLELAKLEPYAKALIEVLREIRDRMPGRPIETVGETPAFAEYEYRPDDDEEYIQDEIARGW